MALTPKLDFRQTQSQSLVMTPQLMQSIRLLQMTHIELTRFLEQEVEKNPLLELAEASEGDFSEPDIVSSDDDGDDYAEPSSDEDWFQTGAVEDAQALASSFDTSLENIFPDDPGRSDERLRDTVQQWGLQTPLAHTSINDYDIDQLSAERPSLAAYVSEQIALSFSSPADRLIATALADGLDENGYLRTDIFLLAQKLGVETAHLETVLAKLQTFDPAGIFARDLSECLATQLRNKGLYTSSMQALLENLELLGRRDFAGLKKISGLGQSAISQMLREIRSLDPKPGSHFEVNIADAIIPDILLSVTREGDWAIELNPAALPRLIVNNNYYAQVRNSVQGQDKTFLSDCMQSAGWLARSLDQRAKTILKVAQEIIRHQDEFLHHGVTHLKPLNLKAIADSVSMHESTISRVIANKFMATPRGVFELRYFFTAAIASSEGGDAHSAESVRHRIRQLIDAENPDEVLSDDAIVDILKKGGVDIARRTVAKYRESMNILSSVQRRREKRAAKNH